jgi:hypothetical protein
MIFCSLSASFPNMEFNSVENFAESPEKYNRFWPWTTIDKMVKSPTIINFLIPWK